MQIAVFGAGSVGCYIGGCLAHAGAKVTLIGRPRILQAIAQHGLTVTDYKGRDQTVPASALTLSESASAAAQADLVLVTVKSAATHEAGQALSSVLAKGAPVISFQNGVSNAAQLAEHLPNNPALPGIVPFNVLDRGEGRFHQGTEGNLMAQASPLPDQTEALFAAANLQLDRPADIRSAQWGKLLINLNNSVNALSGVPLKEELSQWGYRKSLAMAMQEALDCMKAAGITPAKATNLPPQWVPKLMGMPDWLFTRLAGKMLAIDPLARSSMWEDLQAGRRTEIDWINGEVVKLADQLGRKAPINSTLIALMRDAEKGGQRDWTANALYERLKQAT